MKKQEIMGMNKEQLETVVETLRGEYYSLLNQKHPADRNSYLWASRLV